jgi:hypothetical protein
MPAVFCIVMSFAMNPVPIIPATDMKERIEKPHNLTHFPFIRKFLFHPPPFIRICCKMQRELLRKSCERRRRKKRLL